MAPRKKRGRPQASKGTATMASTGMTTQAPVLHDEQPPQKKRCDPPSFKQGMAYDVWKRHVSDWQGLTGTPPQERGAAIRLVLEGKALQAAQHVSDEDIWSKNGVNKLLQELDRVYIPDSRIRKFKILDGLYTMARPAEKPVCDHVTEFADQYLQVQQAGSRMEDDQLAFLLLSTCRLPPEKCELVMGSLKKNGKITYQDTKDTLNTIFMSAALAANKSTSSATSASDMLMTNNSSTESTENATLYGASRQSRERGRSSGGRNFSSNRSRSLSSRGNFGRGAARSASVSGGELNPLSYDGTPRRCFRCNATDHYIASCKARVRPNFVPRGGGFGSRRDFARNWGPRERVNREHEVNFSYLFVGCASSEENKLSQLLKDSMGYAVLDSGCANSVAGEEWFRHYEKQLSVGDKLEIQIGPSDQCYTFGDGKMVKSLRKVTFPCWFGGTRGNFTIDVVPCQIPLLMSRKSMSRANMVVDFGKDEATVHGRTIKLKVTRSGHYALPVSL